MGYSTRYNLSVQFTVNNQPVELKDETPLLSVIKVLREENEEASYAITDDGGVGDGEARWYEHFEDMKAFSSKHPNILFTLHGEGEENDDIWTEYFLNGKGQREKAKIQIAPFNPKELR